MKAGKRHGWGAELPIVQPIGSTESTSAGRKNFFGRWNNNKRVINEENPLDEGLVFRDKQILIHDKQLDDELFKRMKELNIDSDKTLGPHLSSDLTNEGNLKTTVDRMEWRYEMTLDDECREMRNTFDVTEVMQTISSYKLDDKIEKILYTGECNDSVLNLKPMPDGRGILEIYYKD